LAEVKAPIAKQMLAVMALLDNSAADFWDQSKVDCFKLNSRPLMIILTLNCFPTYNY
jgi:hypothetical protein